MNLIVQTLILMQLIILKTLADLMRQIDPDKRPVTFVSDQDYYNDVAMQYFDVICVNRYYAWYTDSGVLPLITYQLSADLQNLHNTFPTNLL